MKQRVISAIVALIICIPIIMFGGIWFDIGISIVGCLGLKELNNVSVQNKNSFIKILSYVSLILIILNGRIFDGTFELSYAISIFLLFIPLIFIDKKNYNFMDAIVIFGNVAFLGFAFSLLRNARVEDLLVFIYLFLITVLTDTFAYICGKSFGKHKLIPKVSPNKTIEGSVSGTLIATIIASIFYIYEINPGVNIPMIILVTFILSIIGQLGDLFFSSIKRYFKIKDFSNIMPGHGGILDRLDSIIFTVIGYTILIGLI